MNDFILKQERPNWVAFLLPVGSPELPIMRKLLLRLALDKGLPLLLNSSGLASAASMEMGALKGTDSVGFNLHVSCAADLLIELELIIAYSESRLDSLPVDRIDINRGWLLHNDLVHWLLLGESQDGVSDSYLSRIDRVLGAIEDKYPEERSNHEHFLLVEELRGIYNEIWLHIQAGNDWRPTIAKMIDRLVVTKGALGDHYQRLLNDVVAVEFDDPRELNIRYMIEELGDTLDLPLAALDKYCHANYPSK
jgi:hypothetical protein